MGDYEEIARRLTTGTSVGAPDNTDCPDCGKSLTALYKMGVVVPVGYTCTRCGWSSMQPEQGREIEIQDITELPNDRIEVTTIEEASRFRKWVARSSLDTYILRL